MHSKSTDVLFQLVKSLEPSEKRHLKIYVKKNAGSDSAKSIQLFDALDKLEEYDEKLLLKKAPSISKQQLSNTKALLTRQIFASLRSVKDKSQVDMQLHEQLDNVRLLYERGLHIHALRVIEKVKETARTYHQYTYIQQALFFEKKIEALYITRSFQNKAEQLAAESEKVNATLSKLDKLSSLALQLYGWYIHNGHARNDKDVTSIRLFFESNLPKQPIDQSSFYERIYLYQCYAWYAFIRLDFLQFYRYTQKWVDLFKEFPEMLPIETILYIKGVHNLMSAHFDLLNADKLTAEIKHFKKFAQTKLVQENTNHLVSTYVYLYTGVLNLHFLEGSFHKGTKMVPYLEEMLIKYNRYLDRHRVLVFYYKIACLYFGSGNKAKAIEYLNRIIHQKDDLRTDLQCYSRLLLLISHYELGNYDLLEYLIKSVYRYMAKMENLSKVEEEVFAFLKNAFRFNKNTIKQELEKLLNKLKRYQNNRLEARAFAYLDIISWLESKIYNKNVQDVIRDKYLVKRRQKK